MLLETTALPSLSTQPHAVFFFLMALILCALSNLLRLLLFLWVAATQEAQRITMRDERLILEKQNQTNHKYK